MLVNSSLENSTSTSGAINTAVSSTVSTVVPGPSSVLANSTALRASSASDSLTRFDDRVWAVAAAATLALSFVW